MAYHGLFLGLTIFSTGFAASSTDRLLNQVQRCISYKLDRSSSAPVQILPLFHIICDSSD